MERQEVLDRWNTRNNRSVVENMSRWMSCRIAKQRAKQSGKPLKRETRLFWGKAMTIVYPEIVSSKIGRLSYFETDMTSMFIDVLRSGMTVYDVGSHFGYFSLLASEIVGDSGHVYAFEPTRSTFEVLQENAARCGNITCNNIAANCETGEIHFQDQGLRQSALNHVVRDKTFNCDQANLISVLAVKLDEFAAQHEYPDFVKIDAEGSEAGILEGMSEIIRQSHPGIGLEMGDQVCRDTGNQPCRETIEFLLDHGYEVFDYQHCQAQPHAVKNSYLYDNLFFRHRESTMVVGAA